MSACFMKSSKFCAFVATALLAGCVIEPPIEAEEAPKQAPALTPNVALTAPKEFFDLYGVQAIAITMPAGEWKKFIDAVENPSKATEDLYFPGQVTIDQKPYANAAFKNFGVGSQVLNPEKANVRIKFDEYNPDLKGPEGLHNLRLKAAGQDPTFLREQLANDLVRAAGGLAPRWTWAQLTVNGEVYGLYIAFEHTDKQMYDRLFDSKDGNEYDPIGGCLGLNCPAKGCAGIKSYYGSDPGDYQTLIQLASAIADSSDEDLLAKVSPLVEVEGLLALYAVEAVVSNYDGLVAAGHNFRTYQDPKTGKLNFIGRSMDLSLGIWEGMYPLQTPWGTPNTWCKNRNDLFYSRAWKVPAVKDKLMTKFRALQCGAFKPAPLKTWLRDMRSRIAPLRLAEPKPTFKPAEEEVSYLLLEKYIDDRGKQLDALLGHCP